MKLILGEDGKYIDTEIRFDLSLSFGGNEASVSAWYLDPPVISPVRNGDFIGAVSAGAPVNFNNIFFNPHAHVTHTESLGHITKDFHSVNEIKHDLFYTARVVTVRPVLQKNGDQIIDVAQLTQILIDANSFEALIIRTLPNTLAKKKAHYSHTNPPFIHVDCSILLEKLGVQHLLIDLPSVDKEEDGGELAFHHAFWKVPEAPSKTKTITEFIFVPEECMDGEYLLNLQMAPIENDASPSRPVIYPVFKT